MLGTKLTLFELVYKGWNLMTSTFKIISNDWYKQQSSPERKLQPINVIIPDYQQTHNHICNMIVSYNDNSAKALIARVLYNQLTGKWIVDGMELVVAVANSAPIKAKAIANQSIPAVDEHILAAHLNNHSHQPIG